MYFDFLIPRRPVSLQAKSRRNLQAWKEFVRSEAERTWPRPVASERALEIALVYLFACDPVDTDNIVKPIQDALVGLIYDDDALITDVGSHRRMLTGSFDLTRCPDALIRGIVSGAECVYVRICTSRPLESYL